MVIDDRLVEKTKEATDNPRERMVLDRLHLLCQLYRGTKPQRVSQETLDKAIERIREKLKATDYTISQDDKRDYVNRLVSVNNMCQSGTRKHADAILHDLSYLESELGIVPSFPWYLEGLLEEKVRDHSEKQLARGSRRWES